MKRNTIETPPIHSLGNRIRLIRRELGKTLAQLADDTGLSRGFLSQVENGQTQLSLSALYRIASALESSAPDLLTGDDQPPVSVVRAGEGELRPASTKNPGQLVRSLLSAPRKNIEAHECVVPAGFRSEPAWSHSGEEFLFILKGRITVEIEGHGATELNAGDAISYSAELPHRWIGHDKESKLINVISQAV